MTISGGRSVSAVHAPTKDRTDPSYLRPLTLTGSG